METNSIWVTLVEKQLIHTLHLSLSDTLTLFPQGFENKPTASAIYSRNWLSNELVQFLRGLLRAITNKKFS